MQGVCRAVELPPKEEKKCRCTGGNQIVCGSDMKNYRNACTSNCLGVKVMNHFGCGYLGDMTPAEMVTDADFA